MGCAGYRSPPGGIKLPQGRVPRKRAIAIAVPRFAQRLPPRYGSCPQAGRAARRVAAQWVAANGSWRRKSGGGRARGAARKGVAGQSEAAQGPGARAARRKSRGIPARRRPRARADTRATGGMTRPPRFPNATRRAAPHRGAVTAPRSGHRAPRGPGPCRGVPPLRVSIRDPSPRANRSVMSGSASGGSGNSGFFRHFGMNREAKMPRTGR